VRTCLCGQDLSRIPTEPASLDALRYATVLSSRLFDELDLLERLADIPQQIARAPMNQLLGLVHLFGNSRFGRLREEPQRRTGWTKRMGDQAAVVSAAGAALADWPQGWHRVLEQLVLQSSPAPAGASRRLLEPLGRAKICFQSLERIKWSAAADYPASLRQELGRLMDLRKVLIGTRCYFNFGAGDLRTSSGPAELRHLWASSNGVEMLHVDDLLSSETVRDMFDASHIQMEAIYRVVLLPRGREWFDAKEVDNAFEALTRWTQPRRPSRHGRGWVSLRQLGDKDPDGLVPVLERVMTGDAETITWMNVRPRGLGNVFVRANASLTGGSRISTLGVRAP
jgi:hypothetical protein